MSRFPDPMSCVRILHVQTANARYPDIYPGFVSGYGKEMTGFPATRTSTRTSCPGKYPKNPSTEAIGAIFATSCPGKFHAIHYIRLPGHPKLGTKTPFSRCREHGPPWL